MKEEYYLADMYRDGYFPDFLVDKIKASLKEVAAILDGGEKDLAMIQNAFDNAIRQINDLEDEFNEHDSEIETVARESIGETVYLMLKHYQIDIDCETAIREREW